MNMIKIATVTLLASCFVCLSLAEDRPGSGSTIEGQSIVREKSAETYDRAAPRIVKAADSPVATTVVSEVFSDVIIAAGKSVNIDSTMDYSSANTVAVAVLCIICGTATTSLGSSGLVLQARWTVPDADSYVTPENKAATAFLYSDAGGAVFNVYGPQFRLTLQNKGTQSIAIQQVTIFRRSQ
jgi:hypothetical protein